jgi:hypothetical protein
MDLIVALVSALLGLSVAFFLSISFYDLAPESWFAWRRDRRGTFDAMREPQALIPRSIQHTTLD